MTSNEDEVFGDSFKPRKIHSINYAPSYLEEENPAMADACDRFREFYGGSYLIEVAEGDIRAGRLPEDICDKLRGFAFKNRWLLESFLPEQIIAALRGEKYEPRISGGPHHKKSGRG